MLSYKSKTFICFFLIYIVWGSTFLFVKIGLGSFTPFILSTLRFLIGGIALLIFALVRKKEFPALRELHKYIISGIITFIGGVAAVVWAQQYLSSSLAAAVITTPFWFIIIDRKQWGFYFSNKKIIAGLGIGLVGVVLLATQKNSLSTSSVNMQIIAMLIMITGSFFWVAGSLYLKYKPSKASPYTITTVQLLSAAAACLFIAVLNGETKEFALTAISTEAWLSVIYLSIMSTTVTYLAFLWLIKRHPPAIVSTYSYVNPLVATLLGWLFANEFISPFQLGALAIILVGVLYVNIGKNSKASGVA